MKNKLIPTDKFLSEVIEFGDDLLDDLHEFKYYHEEIKPEPPKNNPKFLKVLEELLKKVPTL
jgi:hypothetical protein